MKGSLCTVITQRPDKSGIFLILTEVVNFAMDEYEDFNGNASSLTH